MAIKPSIKVTYSLPAEVVEEVRSVVREGAAPSYSAFVERALREAVRRARDSLLAAEYDDAARDRLFLEDVEDVERDFDQSDTESAGLAP